jgi:hypothetical protein
MLSIETSYQDTPGHGYYFVLRYRDRPLVDQLAELGLRDGDHILLWEPDCDLKIEAVLLFDYKHPMMFERALWARTLKRYAHCVRLINAPPQVNDWLEGGGRDFEVVTEVVAGSRVNSWCFVSDDEAREFVGKFGGEPWTAHDPQNGTTRTP